MVGLLVAIVGGIVAPISSAAADPVSSARSQLSALQSQITADSTQLHELTVAYNADALQAGELAQQVQTALDQLQSLQQQIQQNQGIVRQVAVMSYTGEVQTPTSLSVSPLVGQAYLTATVGNITATEDQLRLDQAETSQQLSELRQASTAESIQLKAQAVARQQALVQAGNEQQTLQSDQQRLNALLAEVPAPSRPPAVQGLGTGLVVAVRSQVSPTTNQITSGSTTLTASPAPLIVVAPPETGSGAGGPWLALRQCESGNNYRENTGNGFYGAYQFSATTWTGLGYPGRPDLGAPAMQDAAAMKLQAEAGWGQWPACSATLGL
jgi:hypothetical protein